MKKKEQKIFLSLGSNLGDRNFFLQKAIDLLEELIIPSQLFKSKFYWTKPVGCPEGSGDFLNTAVCLYSLISLKDLLDICLKIELNLGRKRAVLNQERTIDIDILFYSDFIVKKPDLVVPHPRLHKRYFVLRPLMDLDENFVHPILKKSLKDLFKLLK